MLGGAAASMQLTDSGVPAGGEASAENGLRYLRWGGDGEAVQPEKG
jgi:hypothetical protein